MQDTETKNYLQSTIMSPRRPAERPDPDAIPTDLAFPDRITLSEPECPTDSPEQTQQAWLLQNKPRPLFNAGAPIHYRPHVPLMPVSKSSPFMLHALSAAAARLS